MDDSKNTRRDFLTLTAVSGSLLVLNACAPAIQNVNTQVAKVADDKDEKEVTAVEDLMREHGILRRALLIFGEAAVYLPSNAPKMWPEAVQQTAKLFRTFGEDYHERRLEEEFIFPLIKQKGLSGPAATYPDLLTAQHLRGREITDFILSATAGASLSHSQEVASALTGFVRMYDAHAAREDTIVFPAWKDLITSDEYEELGEKFEEIEHTQFGEDGYEQALKQIAEIEASVGFTDISVFTPAQPATAK